MSENPAIACLLRIMAKATEYANREEVDWAGLAATYENAIFKELADLTAELELNKD